MVFGEIIQITQIILPCNRQHTIKNKQTNKETIWYKQKPAGKKSDNINRSTGTPITKFPDADFKINMLTTFQEIKDIKNFSRR